MVSLSSIWPVGCWWQALENIDVWVKERGVNVLIWQNQINGNAGDFEKMHEHVEALRQAGYPLWVIRQPGYLLSPDPQPVAFDQKWKSHLMAFSLVDEFEDKVAGGNLWNSPKPIIDYATAQVAAYRAWMPDVPIFANFNGTHISATTVPVYTKIVATGIDILCQDLYPICTQQVMPDGKTFLWQLSDFFNGTALLKAATGKPCWTYVETCNQDICQAGADGWSQPWKFVGSRAPTSDELWQMFWYVQNGHGDGVVYFPQAHNGATNDATPPDIAALLPQLGAHMQPSQSTPAPVPQPVPAPPTPTPAPTPVPVQPPAKKALYTLTVYADGTVTCSPC